MKEKLVIDAALTEKELEELREVFKREYAKKRGWDINNLTNEQLNEVYSDPSWKSNFLLKS